MNEITTQNADGDIPDDCKASLGDMLVVVLFSLPFKMLSLVSKRRFDIRLEERTLGIAGGT